jgi:hypothetical protein
MKERRHQVQIATAVALTLVVLLSAGGGVIAQPPASESPAVQPHMLQAASTWSSGWVSINQGQMLTLNHNLGGDPEDYALELFFLDTASGGLGINRRAYGSLEVNGQRFGAYWQNLTSSTIQVYRQPNDENADRIFVWIGVVPASTSSFNSGWITINPGQTISIAHNLGIPAEDLTVSLWFKSAARGIHHFAYGGLAMDGPQQMLGAHWQNLTSNSVEVIRHPDDTDVEQVRVVVVEPSTPAYDSLESLGGWQSIDPGASFVFAHSRTWVPTMVLVRGECYDSSGLRGIHQLFAGGNHDWLSGFQGANLQNLTVNSVSVYRQLDDEFCPEVRVRIWTRATRVFLPIVLGE